MTKESIRIQQRYKNFTFDLQKITKENETEIRAFVDKFGIKKV